jgi:hypothetical protein
VNARTNALCLAILALFLSVTTARLSPHQAPRQTPAQQSTSAAAPAQSPAPDLSAGTTICADLAKTIDAKSAKPGEPVVARVTLPVLDKGKVILQNDAKILGHVVSANTQSKTNQSQIAIVFDHAILKDGAAMPLSLTVQAIGHRASTATELADQDPYGPVAQANTNSMPPQIPSARETGPARMAGHTPGAPTPDSAAPGAATHNPTLDASSHGAIGLPDLTLTESSDAAAGSVVTSAKKNVKLESGMQIVLRVIAANTGS